MKKKPLIIVLALVLVGAVGCITTQPQTPQNIVLTIKAIDQPVEIAKESAKDSKDVVSKSMVIENPEGTLSNISFICRGKGYLKIWGGLSVFDAQNVWNDIVVMTTEYGITEIHIFLNSPGGDAFSGLALADEIQRAERNGCNVIAHASGIVASAAVPVFAACSQRIAAPGTIFMVHEASLWKMFAQEKAKDLESQLEMMNLLQDKYLSLMAAHSKLSKKQWKDFEAKTTWFSAEKAKEWGLVDKIE